MERTRGGWIVELALVGSFRFLVTFSKKVTKSFVHLPPHLFGWSVSDGIA